jgi:hypothetical protein
MRSQMLGAPEAGACFQLLMQLCTRKAQQRTSVSGDAWQ